MASGRLQGHMQTTRAMQPTILLNLNEVAAQLRWTRRSVEREIQYRRLRAVHLGRSGRVERSELDRYVAAMRDPVDPVPPRLRPRRRSGAPPTIFDPRRSNSSTDTSSMREGPHKWSTPCTELCAPA